MLDWGTTGQLSSLWMADTKICHNFVHQMTQILRYLGEMAKWRKRIKKMSVTKSICETFNRKWQLPVYTNSTLAATLLTGVAASATVWLGNAYLRLERSETDQSGGEKPGSLLLLTIFLIAALEWFAAVEISSRASATHTYTDVNMSSLTLRSHHTIKCLHILKAS